jgi:phage-related minor tail protein
LLKPITDKFKSSAGDLLNNIFGEDYIKGFVDRLGISMKQFIALFENTEAPATYFENIKNSANDAGDAIEKSFGQQMRDKLKTFNDSIKTIQESMADVVVKGIKGMEDALVDFVMTGKLNFKNLANAIIADMARIAIQQSITRPLLNYAGGLFGVMAGSGGKDVFEGFNRGAAGYANGGRPPVGRASIVGERGAELFVPDRAGTIIPNHKLGGTTNVVVNVDASGTSVQGNDTNANEFGKQLAAAIQSEIINQKRTGGLLA